MKKDGLQRLLEFLDVLREKNIWCRIEQTVPDAIMVTLTLVGARVEVSFFVDELQFSVFRGPEDVNVDEGELMALIAELGG